jgi:hypothetical protein
MKTSRFKPTEEQRRTIRKLAGFGVPQRQICAIVGVSSPKLLRKHFRQELSLGPVEATANVMRTAFRLAISGRNPAMTIFWLKTRARWSETTGLPVQEERPSQPFQFIIEEYQPPRSPDEERKLAELMKNFASASRCPDSDWGGDGPESDDLD